MNWSELFPAGSYVTNEAEIIVRLVLAIVLGGSIGLERELRDHPAGLRTHMLTALAAAVFTILTLELFHQLDRMSGENRSDPIRIVEAVTAGVSFLAAGTIIQSRGQVAGLTTGAAMWLAGAIGVACGLGFYLIAVAAALLGISVVVIVRKIEGRVLNTKKSPADDQGGTP